MNKNEKEKNEVNDKNIKVNDDKNINNDEDKNYDVKVLHEIKIAYAKSGLDNTFAYVSFYDIPYLVFSSKEKSIISYNLKELSVATEIKNAHENSISKFRSYEKNIKQYIFYLLVLLVVMLKFGILKIGNVFLI